MRGLVLFFILIVFNFLALVAQDRRVVVQIDTPAILIGEQVTATLKVEVEEGKRIKFPQIDKFLTDKLEVVEVSDIDSLKTGSTYVLSKALKITSFDSGNHLLPKFKFLLIENNSIDTIKSQEVFLRVNMMPVDTASAIKDIKAPIDTPFQSNELWSYLTYLIYIIIGIVTVMIIMQFRKLQQGKPQPLIIPQPIPNELAEVVALKELETLRKNKNWNTPQGVKDYYEELSVILRKYIHNRFKIDALERTTSEILIDFESRALEKNLYKILNEILITSDYVKFAKYIPSANENEIRLDNSFLFVRKTHGESFINKTHV